MKPATIPSGITLVPGLPGPRLVIRGCKITIGVGAINFLIVFATDFERYKGLYVAAVTTVGMGGIIVGCAIMVYGLMKDKRESAHGYTFWGKTADKAPNLYHLAYGSFEVISAPDHSRAPDSLRWPSD